jgi:hypothetical protein
MTKEEISAKLTALRVKYTQTVDPNMRKIIVAQGKLLTKALEKKV